MMKQTFRRQYRQAAGEINDSSTDTFENFLVKALRRAPAAVIVVVSFFLVRGMAFRAGAVMLLVAAAGILPLSLLRPDLGLFALIVNFTNEFDSYYQLNQYVPVSIPLAFDFAIAFGILLRIIRERERPALAFSQNFLLLAYVFWVSASVLVSNVESENLFANFRSGFLIRPILYLFIVILIRSRRDIYRTVTVFLVAHALSMTTAFSDFLQKGGGDYRVQGSFAAINYLSYVCVATFPLIVAIGAYLKNRMAKILVLSLALLTLFVTMQTLSRSGYFALGATLIFLASRLVARPRTILYAVAFALVFYVAVPDSLMKRLGEVQSIEDTSRYKLAQIGYRMMIDNPFLGVGWHGYRDRFEQYDTENAFRGSLAPHSLYFAIAAQSGIPALILYMATYILTLYQTFLVQDTYRRAGDTTAFGFYAAIGIEAGLVGHFVFGLAGSYGDSYYAFFLLGLSVVIVRYHRLPGSPLLK